MFASPSVRGVAASIAARSEEISLNAASCFRFDALAREMREMDRMIVVEGKSGDLGGQRIIKKHSVRGVAASIAARSEEISLNAASCFRFDALAREMREMSSMLSTGCAACSRCA